MFDQLDLEEVPKSAKKMEKTSNFQDFLSEDLQCEK
jgi:hypothetical protein